MTRHLTTAFTLFLSTATVSLAAPLAGKVVAVDAPTTLTLRDSAGKNHRVRLAWVAPPARAHACWPAARRTLSELVLHKPALVHLQGDQVDGATRARVELPQSNGQRALDPAEELLGKGLATQVEQPSRTQHDHFARITYTLVQNSAQGEKRGVWGAGCNGKER